MIKLLLVEDNLQDAHLTQDLFAVCSPDQFEFVHVNTLAEALRRLGRERFEAVLLDLSLPDTKGLDTVSQMLATSPGVPVVILSGWGDEAVGLEAVRKGAQDFLVKGQGNGAILTRAVRYAIERKRAEDRLAYYAQHDALTGLANRFLFRDRLLQALARSRRTKRVVGLLLLDLDRFKAVNDAFGHECGDRLLRGAAERLYSCVREVDAVCRLGGDEFTVVLEGVSDENDLTAVAQRILDAIARPFDLDGQQVTVGVSVGITAFPRDNQNIDGLLRHADVAMYRAKELGGQTYRFYIGDKDSPASVSPSASRL